MNVLDNVFLVLIIVLLCFIVETWVTVSRSEEDVVTVLVLLIVKNIIFVIGNSVVSRIVTSFSIVVVFIVTVVFKNATFLVSVVAVFVIFKVIFIVLCIIVFVIVDLPVDVTIQVFEL